MSEPRNSAGQGQGPPSGGPSPSDDNNAASPSRPSFSSFWKKSKEKAAAAAGSGPKSLTFVVSSSHASAVGVASPALSNAGADAAESAGESGPSPAEGHSAKEKAQMRRAQVRKAQIEHRRRKATYVKQLEDDIAELRNLISAAEQDSSRLRRENEVARVHLAAVGTTTAAFVLPPVQEQQLGPRLQPSQSPPDITLPDIDDIDIDIGSDTLEGVSVVFAMDEDMGEPCYRLVSSSPSSNGGGGGFSDASGLSPLPGAYSEPPTSTTLSPPPLSAFASTDPQQPSASSATFSGHDGISGLDEEQTQQAINFILALEHVCWEHFRPSDFDPAMEIPGVLTTYGLAGLGSGHTLTASAIALRQAPPTAFSAMWMNQPGGIVRRCSSRSHMVTVGDGGEIEPCPPSSASPGAGAGGSSPPTQQQPPLSWGVSGLTLQSLRGLADSINPASDKEVAPVQAWFELCARFPPSLLLRPDVVSALKREFVGVVKCLHLFGAIIERVAFESVIQRVMGAAMGMGEEEQQHQPWSGPPSSSGGDWEPSPRMGTTGA